ncbi:MAG: ABC transporter ATP-binding protein [Propionibacteriaceae bacterium]|nr:ABC transporter ATP-binding protein [Propionibacteriaceae bacterium]
MSPASHRPLLSVENLTAAATLPQPRPILRGVGFTLAPGQRTGIVGPSGSGKSMILKALTGFAPPSIEVTGTVALEGADVLALPAAQRHRLVTATLALLWQDSMQSLNPYETIGTQFTKTLRLHRSLPGDELRGLAAQWLDRVGLPHPDKVLRAYPHQLSGGMRQRTMLAMSLCGDQPIVVADEPTTALDVVRQAECIELIDELSRGRDRALLYVSHDLALTARLCTHVMVVDSGTIVESGTLDEVFGHPQHDVTRQLLHGTRKVRPR